MGEVTSGAASEQNIHTQASSHDTVAVVAAGSISTAKHSFYPTATQPTASHSRTLLPHCGYLDPKGDAHPQSNRDMPLLVLVLVHYQTWSVLLLKYSLSFPGYYPVSIHGMRNPHWLPLRATGCLIWPLTF